MRGKSKYPFITFSVGVGLALALGLLRLMGHTQSAHAAPSILYVALDGNDANNCASAANRCQTVQRAVDAAQAGDEIRVAAGVYTGVSVRQGITQMVYISKTVTLRGGYTTADWTTPDPVTNPTTLDAQGQGRVLVISGSGPTIEGFIITGGKTSGYFDGGGISVVSASPVIRGNQIVGNSSHQGGAVSVVWGSAQIHDNRIISNTAQWGGGIYTSGGADVTIVGNDIVSNTVHWGGGINLGAGNILVAQNLIAYNSGRSGGGVSVGASRTHAKLVNNIFVGNQVTNQGSDVILSGTESNPVSVTLSHNTLVGDLGQGPAVDVLSGYVTVTLKNNIIVSHTEGIVNNSPISSTVTADHTLFYGNGTNYSGGVSSVNEVVGDPAFIAPAADNYHIGTGSAAVDAGLAAGVNDDFDGDFRPRGAGYDIGADEFLYGAYWRIYLPLILR